MIRPGLGRVEEAVGTVRYLRPAYQVSGQQQGTMALVAAAADVTPAEAQPWSTELAQQMQALRAVVQGGCGPADGQAGGSALPGHQGREGAAAARYAGESGAAPARAGAGCLRYVISPKCANKSPACSNSKRGFCQRTREL